MSGNEIDDRLWRESHRFHSQPKRSELHSVESRLLRLRIMIAKTRSPLFFNGLRVFVFPIGQLLANFFLDYQLLSGGYKC